MFRNQNKLRSNKNEDIHVHRNKPKAVPECVSSLPHVIHVLDANYKTAYDFRQKLKQCTYFESIRVVLFVWTAIGRLPVWRDKTGEYIMPIYLSVYSLMMGSLIVLISGGAAIALAKSMLNGESVFEISKPEDGGGYNYSLFWICLILVTTYNLSLPFFDWTATRKFRKFLRSWIKFQENYTLISGRVLEMKRTMIGVLFSMNLLVNLVLVGFIMNYTMKNFNWFSRINTLLAIVEVECRTAFFWHSCGIICNCTEQLSNTFSEELASEERTTNKIGDYRRLWLELMDILLGLSDLMSYKMTHLIFVCVIFIIVSSYHMALSALSRGVSSAGDIYLYSFSCIYTAVHVLCACESGHRVAQSLGKKFLEKATLHHLHELTFAERKEFSLFMSIVRRRSPSVVLSGYLTVDRSLIVHVISGSLTYLIILVQFKVGMSKTDRLHHNISQYTA